MSSKSIVIIFITANYQNEDSVFLFAQFLLIKFLAFLKNKSLAKTIEFQIKKYKKFASKR